MLSVLKVVLKDISLCRQFHVKPKKKTKTISCVLLCCISCAVDSDPTLPNQTTYAALSVRPCGTNNTLYALCVVTPATTPRRRPSAMGRTRTRSLAGLTAPGSLSPTSAKVATFIAVNKIHEHIRLQNGLAPTRCQRTFPAPTTLATSTTAAPSSRLRTSRATPTRRTSRLIISSTSSVPVSIVNSYCYVQLVYACDEDLSTANSPVAPHSSKNFQYWTYRCNDNYAWELDPANYEPECTPSAYVSLTRRYLYNYINCRPSLRCLSAPRSARERHQREISTLEAA